MTISKLRSIFPKAVTLLVAISLLAPLGMLVAPTPAAAQAGTVVRVAPSTSQIGVNETISVEVQVENVTGLAAADIEIRFNASILQVQDADSGREGVQIQPGNFPAPDFVAMNMVDNSAGIIRYALTQLPPHEPVNGGGVMATINFRGVNAGSSELDFTVVNLANAQGQALSNTFQNGSIGVGSAPPPPPTPGPGTPTPIPTYAPPTPGPGTPTPIPTYAPPTPGPGTPTPMPTVAPPPPPPGNRYVVQPGDTLYSIARRYNVTVWDLASYNNIYNVNLIYVGQVLIIPGGGQPQPGSTYTVRYGDTLYSIARRYGMTVWQLASYNNIANPNYIYAGQVLRIPIPQ
jgi:LysM repeat protein